MLLERHSAIKWKWSMVSCHVIDLDSIKDLKIIMMNMNHRLINLNLIEIVSKQQPLSNYFVSFAGKTHFTSILIVEMDHIIKITLIKIHN